MIGRRLESLRSPLRSRLRRAAAPAAACLSLLPAGALAQVREYSPDTSVTLGGVLFDDEDVAVDNLADVVLPQMLGPLPESADVDAYHRLESGDVLLSLDVSTELSGALTAEPADVVRWDRSVYSLELDASAHGVPEGVDVDAVSSDGATLVVSFDTAVDLGGGVVAEDEDLVRLVAGGASLLLDGSAQGVPEALDVDAAEVLGSGRFLLSFDGSATLGGVDFDDDDLLVLDTGGPGWSLFFEGAARHASLEPADVVAAPEPSAGLLVAAAALCLLGLAVCRRQFRQARRPATARGRSDLVRAMETTLEEATMPRRRHAPLPHLLALVGALFASQSARAVDGVIEINAARLAAGIPAIGDTAGPPVTIGEPGSYVLTSDLFVTGSNQTVVEITADHVTLDLNGFAVRCLFALTPCKGTGTGVGIVASGLNATIRNGTVRDMADDGISASGLGAVVEGVRAIENGGVGIDVGSAGRIEDCVAIGNGDDGLSASINSVVRDSTAQDNADIGISGSFAVLITGNTVRGSPFGIAAQQSTIEGNVVFGNGEGIQGSRSLIRDNTVTDNTGDGITGSEAIVVGNQIFRNGGFGIDLAAAYGGNLMLSNNSGMETQANQPGLPIDGNACGADGVCP